MNIGKFFSQSDFDAQAVRKQFPILNQEVHGQSLVYLDNAATSQKPQAVMDALNHYYENDNANVHRGVHSLSERATLAYEAARKKSAEFIGAEDPHNIIFVRGTTEAVNLVAQSFARPQLKTGDEILVTHLEHHSNLVPWQLVCKQTGASLKVAPIHDDGSVDQEAFANLLSEKTKIVSMVHISNALGIINPVKAMTEKAKAVGATVMVDGAQAAPHEKINVQDIGCDFYAFSSHKVFGPTGVGVLYGKADILNAMEPYQGGGEMITRVTLHDATYNEVPFKFEAGTPNIAGAIGLHAALEFVDSVGHDAIAKHEHELLTYATEQLSSLPGLTIFGTNPNKASVVSFTLEGIHPHDIGTIVDSEGVAIRTGHHCAMPLMDRLGVAATARASFAFYNTKQDVDRLVKAIVKTQEMFA